MKNEMQPSRYDALRRDDEERRMSIAARRFR
jgi:hypothetical protein